MRTFSAEGQTLRNIISAVRKQVGVDRKLSRVLLTSGGEDNCYRIHLEGDIIIEATTRHMKLGEATQVQEIK